MDVNYISLTLFKIKEIFKKEVMDSPDYKSHYEMLTYLYRNVPLTLVSHF